MHPGREKRARGFLQVERNAVRATEVVEGSSRQHTHGAARVVCCLGHCVERAVPTGSDHHATLRAGLLGRPASGQRDLRASLRRDDVVSPACRFQHLAHHVAHGVGIANA